MGTGSLREGGGVGWGTAIILWWPGTHRWQSYPDGFGGTVAHSACSERDSRCFPDPTTANLSYNS